MHLTEYSNTETEKQAKIHFDKIKQTHLNEGRFEKNIFVENL